MTKDSKDVKEVKEVKETTIPESLKDLGAHEKSAEQHSATHDVSKVGEKRADTKDEKKDDKAEEKKVEPRSITATYGVFKRAYEKTIMPPHILTLSEESFVDRFMDNIDLVNKEDAEAAAKLDVEKEKLEKEKVEAEKKLLVGTAIETERLEHAAHAIHKERHSAESGAPYSS